MTAIEAQLIERLKKLPPSRVAEVVDFVEFLAAREERAAAAQRLTEGLARLDALDMLPVSEDEIEAARHARAQRGA
jgi:predicted nucleic acid-binding protein